MTLHWLARVLRVVLLRCRRRRRFGQRLLSLSLGRPGQPLGAKLYGADGKSQRTGAEQLREPIQIRVLPAGRSLDYISEKPKPKHKHPKTAADRTTEDMFAFLNSNMNAPGQGVGSNAFDEGGWRRGGGGSGGAEEKKQVHKKKTSKRSEKELRIELLAKQRHLGDLQVSVGLTVAAAADSFHRFPYHWVGLHTHRSAYFTGSPAATIVQARPRLMII
eukprot:COSAG05_NODE_665_length_8009_cov_156.415929_3_plen_218_part_00